MNEDLSALMKFNGTARLFPLPNLVLFPFVQQGLHIFEPRYRAMTADALTTDRLLALALLRAGWQNDYEGRPPIHSVVCLGEIVRDQHLPDGRYNLQLRGLVRARVAKEVPSDGKPYRSAAVEILRDGAVPGPETDRQLRRQLVDLLSAWWPGQPKELEVFRRLLLGKSRLSMVSDVLAFALPLAVEVKQELLENLDVEQRVRSLLYHLETKAPSSYAMTKLKFPPEFSTN